MIIIPFIYNWQTKRECIQLEMTSG